MSAKGNNNLHSISLFYFCVYVYVCVGEEGGRKVGGVQGGFYLTKHSDVDAGRGALVLYALMDMADIFSTVVHRGLGEDQAGAHARGGQDISQWLIEVKLRDKYKNKM